MIINKASLTGIFNAYSAAFQGGFSSVDPMYQQFSTVVPSSTKSNTYGFLGQFPSLREWVGDKQIKDLAAHTYAITNRDFESTIGVKRSTIEDDEYGTYALNFAQMGNVSAIHPDQLTHELLLAGASTLCYDGQFFFDTDHPTGKNGASTASNYDSTGGGDMWILMDTSKPLKPVIFQKRKDYTFQQLTDPNSDSVMLLGKYIYGVEARCNTGFGMWQTAYASLNTLDATNFNAAIAAMMALEGDEGQKLMIRPNLLVVGPSNRSAALQLIKAENDADGSTNINFQAVEVLVSPLLS